MRVLVLQKGLVLQQAQQESWTEHLRPEIAMVGMQTPCRKAHEEAVQMHLGRGAVQSVVPWMRARLVELTERSIGRSLGVKSPQCCGSGWIDLRF